jgi:lipopolysaccharide transport system ATP-binding protein
MSQSDILFENVSKQYILYHHISGGMKNFLFHFPQAIRSMRNARFEALRDISFEVPKGQTLGCIGRNGAGKSTLLGLMAGVLRPSSGTIRIRERVSPLLELGGGFHPELSGRENIMMNGVLLGMLRSEVLARSKDIIDFSELGEFIDQPIRTYSSGMLARLGFSVVAHLDPKIILVDEVLAVGDAAFRAKCIRKMMEFKKGGATIVFVSHSPEDVSLICDRVLWIENHRIRKIGSTDETLKEYLGTK